MQPNMQRPSNSKPFQMQTSLPPFSSPRDVRPSTVSPVAPPTSFFPEQTFIPPDPFEFSSLTADLERVQQPINPLLQIPQLNQIFSNPSTASTETSTPSLTSFQNLFPKNIPPNHHELDFDVDINSKNNTHFQSILNSNNSSASIDNNVSQAVSRRHQDIVSRPCSSIPSVRDHLSESRAVVRSTSTSTSVPVITGPATLKQPVDLRFLLRWRPVLRHILGSGICEKSRTTVEEILLRLISVVMKGAERTPRRPVSTNQQQMAAQKEKEWYHDELVRLNEKYESAHRQNIELTEQLLRFTRKFNPESRVLTNRS